MASAPITRLFGWIVLVFAIDLRSLSLVNGHSTPQVPCYFIFGDSLADNGNNNHLLSQAKANFLPYGIDYPDGPTGRFTNGRNYVDFIGLALFCFLLIIKVLHFSYFSQMHV